MEYYRYERLESGSIRLLNVLNTQTAEIRCQLLTADLNTAPKFIALSYCWGAPKGNISVICDNAIIHVTPNLHGFLTHFASQGPEYLPPVWVDAVCINQEDINERNAQVAMIQHIYQQAAKTVVWLGEGTEESDIAMKFIPQLLRADEKSKEDRWTSQDLKEGDVRKLCLPSRTESLHFFYSALFLRPWFRRVWIIQEVAMSQDVEVVCGQQRVSWKDFSRAFWFAHQLGVQVSSDIDKGHIEGLQSTFAIIKTKESRQCGLRVDLLGLLLRCRKFLASDVRDKVFALLGLADDTGPEALDFQPDYGLDIATVYTRLAFALIHSESSLDVLSARMAPSRELQVMLPSWVPDWSTPVGLPTFSGRESLANHESFDMERDRNATKDSLAVARLGENEKTLGIEGYVVDHIERLGSVLPGSDELQDYKIYLFAVLSLMRSYIQVFIEWEGFAEPFSGETYAWTNESIMDAYWKTITACSTHMEAEVSRADFLEWNSYYHPLLSLRNLVGYSIASSSLFAWLTLAISLLKILFRGSSDPIFGTALDIAENRRLIRTSKGLLGLAPAAARQNDRIGLFKGGRVPLVVRQKTQHWELIGDVYVHGMMEGELFTADSCETMWFV
ncbi:heterokaryon incompatibility protein-domain-containing protein [Lineolata rhizophorae]|uniref:Heterokaryon incompatibility protein-domain-containing protein n=1 Tax=Lineolata rhizophorae TaxID=578093 RepID=A0A6A6PEA3_9PEZI|nr:heterokaryon incompatibility protein-domain-containing protein [Lineolata rhizophorae]